MGSKQADCRLRRFSTMRRLILWGFNLSAAVSALLLIGICVLWIRSYRVSSADYFEWSRDAGVPPEHPDPTVVPMNADSWVKFYAAYERWDRNNLKFHIRANRDAIQAFGRQPFFGYPRNSFNVNLPYLALMPALAFLPALRLTRLMLARHARSRHPWACRACSYDLRATPNRCPECGTVPKSKPNLSAP